MVNFSIEIADINAAPAIQVIYEKWLVANMWVGKLAFSSTIKIPYRYHPYKSLGFFAYNLFLVCERITTLNKKDNPRLSSIDWFNHCISELCRIEMEECLSGITIIENSWKKSFIDSESRKLAMLRNIETDKPENPYAKYQNSKAISKLVLEAQIWAGRSNVFREKVWKPFIKSYSLYIKDLKSNPNIKHGYIENGDYVLQIGKGKSNAAKRTSKIVYKIN